MASGSRKNIRFWEDLWYGTSPLAVQYWELFCICQQQCQTIHELWDGENLKITFRRTLDERLFSMWLEIVEIAKSISFSDCHDSLVWQYKNSGLYSSSSLYAVINFRGVTPVFIPTVWKLVVPPRIHVFLWLLFHNKIMTRDNLNKRNMKKPEECVFCLCKESVQHLFFECIVAKNIWNTLNLFFGRNLGSDFISIASLWVAGKKLDVINSVIAAVLWALWKHRNSMIFYGSPWISLNQIWWLVLRLIRKWEVIFKDHMSAQVTEFCHHIRSMVLSPAQLTWGH